MNDLDELGVYLQFRNTMNFLLELEEFIQYQLEQRENFQLIEPIWKTLLLTKSMEPSVQDDKVFRKSGRCC
jgi:hypothetical protein